MRRIATVLVAALFAFYVAWPAWSGYRISQAFQTDNVELLDSKIDFVSVRANLKPIAAAELEKSLEKLRQDQGGLGGLIASTLKGAVGTQVLDTVLEATVTAPALMRVVRDGHDLREMLKGVLAKVDSARNPSGKGPGGDSTGTGSTEAPPPVAAPTSSPPPEKRRIGIANIKRITPHGLLSYSLGVARDPAAAEPDATATLAFTGGDWKVVSLVPRG
jgi:hypothetical protein